MPVRICVFVCMFDWMRMYVFIYKSECASHEHKHRHTCINIKFQ